jgi:hypothetical protein
MWCYLSEAVQKLNSVAKFEVRINGFSRWLCSALPLRSKWSDFCFSDKVFRDSVANKSVPQRGSVWVAAMLWTTRYYSLSTHTLPRCGTDLFNLVAALLRRVSLRFLR